MALYFLPCLFMKKNPISSTVDFEKDGVQHGYLKLPHSHDASAWGSIVIPITVSDKPKFFAISVAPLINNIEP